MLLFWDDTALQAVVSVVTAVLVKEVLTNFHALC